MIWVYVGLLVFNSKWIKFRLQNRRGRANWTIRKQQIESNLKVHDLEGMLGGQIDEPMSLAMNTGNQQKKE